MSKVLLGDVAAERRETCKGSKDGYPTVGLEHLTPEEITLTSWNGSSGNTFTKMFHKGDVLFGRRRAYLKKAAVAPFDGICSGDITVITAKPDYLLPELLPFIIQNDALFDFAVERSAGSLSPRVKWEHLKNYEFSLPDMEKQHELSELLWAMDATKKTYQQLIAATDELVKSQFIEWFGDPAQNSMGWPLVKLEECLIRIDSGKSINCENYPRTGTHPAILKLSAVTYGEYIPTENKQLPSDNLFLPDAEVHAGDLLFSRKNTLEYVGMTVLVKETPCKLMLPDLIFRLVLQDNIRAEYLHQLINHPLYRTVISSLANGTTGSMPNISKQKLKGLAIPLPPVDVQKQIEPFIYQSDKSKFELEQALSELTATYKRIISEQLG